MNNTFLQKQEFWKSFHRNQAGWHVTELEEIPPDQWEIRQSVPMEAVSEWADDSKKRENPVDLYAGEAALSPYGKKIYREALQLLPFCGCSFGTEKKEIKTLKDESGFLSHKARSFFLLTSDPVIAGRMAVLLKSRRKEAHLFCSSLLGEKTANPSSFVVTVREGEIFSWPAEPERYALPPWDRGADKSTGGNGNLHMTDQSLILLTVGLLRSLAGGKSILSSIDDARKYGKNRVQLK